MIVCIDSNIVIYCVERDPVWEPKVAGRFKTIAAAGDTLAASDAARLECLVGPLQSGDAALLADYRKFFGSPAGPQGLLTGGGDSLRSPQRIRREIRRDPRRPSRR